MLLLLHIYHTVITSPKAVFHCSAHTHLSRSLWTLKCQLLKLCQWVAVPSDSVFFGFDSSGAFFLYSSLALLGFFFVYGCLPETKARRLEEIEVLFENQLCSCGISESDEGRQVEYIRVKGSNYHLSDNDASDVD